MPPVGVLSPFHIIKRLGSSDPDRKKKLTALKSDVKPFLPGIALTLEKHLAENPLAVSSVQGGAYLRSKLCQACIFIGIGGLSDWLRRYSRRLGGGMTTGVRTL